MLITAARRSPLMTNNVKTRMCGDDSEETQLGVAVTAPPSLFLIGRVFIMKMQFHSISCSAPPPLAVFNMTKGFVFFLRAR